MDSDKNDIYDVSEYNDTELYDILDVNNPSDRELEAQILSYIEKYEGKENEESNKMHQFFEDVYSHFFEEEGEEKEGFEAMVEEPEVETLENESKPEITKNTPHVANYTKDVKNSASSLNPRMLDSVTKTIILNSENRNVHKFSSVNYKVPLSTPIYHVISIKVTSYSIPYTWYNLPAIFTSSTTNQKFNYFVVKGKTNTSAFGKDFIIQMESGNYNPTNFIATINQSIADSIASIQTETGVDITGTEIYFSKVHQKIKCIFKFMPVSGTAFTTLDFDIYFYNPRHDSIGPYSFDHVFRDNTLGWIMGFKSYTKFDLSDQTTYIKTNDYFHNATNNTVSLTGDSCLDLNTIKTLYLCIEDYTSHKANDGIITNGTDETTNFMGNTNPAKFSTNNNGSFNSSTESSNGQTATASSVAAANASVNETYHHVRSKNKYSDVCNPPNCIAVLPLKLASVATGTLLCEIGGGIPENNRTYHGPVNIDRMHVSIYTNKNQLLDLNGANWSTTLSVTKLVNYNNT